MRAILVAVAVLLAAGASHASPVVEQAKREIGPIIDHRALVTEIEGMYGVDMIMRREFLALRKDASDDDREQLGALWRTLYEPVDAEHTARLKVLLQGRGWFRVGEVGRKAADDALTLANHSPDNAFQHEVVAMLDALPAAERPDGYANIWDRVALQEGRLQRYGTQDYRCADGRHIPSDRIEDPEHLAERRAEVGLGPIADDLIQMDKMYGRCSEVDPRPKAG